MSNRYRSVVGAHQSTSSKDVDDGCSETPPTESMSFWINGVLTLGLVVLGVSGNLAMMMSLRCNTKRWLPLYYYFMTFALWNTTLLLATVVFYCLSALQPDDFRYYKSPIFAYLNIIGYPLANSGMIASVWLVLCLTVERCFVVSRPLQRVVSETKKRAKLVTLAISLLAPLYSMPLFFELRVEEVENDRGKNSSLSNNETTEAFYDVVKTGLRDDITYKIIYRIVCNLVFLSLVPFVIVISLSGRIVCVIRNRSDNDGNGNGGNLCQSPWPNNNDSPRVNNAGSPFLSSNYSSSIKSEETTRQNQSRKHSFRGRCHSRASYDHSQKTHVTLTILASKYVVCYTLPTLLNILEIIVEPRSLREMGLGLVVDLSDLMVVADSALNAFVYFSWRRKIQLRGLSFRSKNKKTQLLQQSSLANEEKKRVTLL